MRKGKGREGEREGRVVSFSPPSFGRSSPSLHSSFHASTRLQKNNSPYPDPPGPDSPHPKPTQVSSRSIFSLSSSFHPPFPFLLPSFSLPPRSDLKARKLTPFRLTSRINKNRPFPLLSLLHPIPAQRDPRRPALVPLRVVERNIQVSAREPLTLVGGSVWAGTPLYLTRRTREGSRGRRKGGERGGGPMGVSE